MSRSFIFFLFLLAFPLSIQAQGLPINGGGINLTPSTDNPIPGQKITITARSFSININTSNLTWFVNGKVAQKGQGLTILEIMAPALGKTTNIVVSAITSENLTITGTLKITSGYIDLIIESDGFVHPFYKGKIPVSYQNRVSVIAIPHLADSNGLEYDPKVLTYQWKKNGRVIEEDSGYGKQSISIIGDIVPRTVSISVLVSTKDASQKALGMISIPYNPPSLAFYIDDPLYGPFFNKAVSENVFIGKEKEVSVLSIPYGFNKPIKNIGNLILTWMINGYEHPELSTNEAVTLRAPESASGKSNIELTIRNNKEILQTASASFSAQFDSKNN